MGRARGAKKSFAATVPERDEVLPNGVTVHWPEIYYTPTPYPAIRVPVTCPNPWGNDRCRGKRDVRVSRGLSKPGLLMTAALAQDGCEFNGLCRECKKLKNRPNQKLPATGSDVMWPELSDDGLPVICGNCGVRWVLKYAAQAGRAGFTGHCRACANGMRRGDEEHPSGTIIHWDKRHPEHISLIGITCHACKNEDGIDRYAWHAEVTDDSWSGLCRECSSQQPPHNKYQHDEELELSKSVIHWGERDPQDSQKVMISCGLCRRAGKTTKRLMHVSAYRSWKKNKRAGHCREHYSDPDALVALLQSSANNGNGQPEKKEPGRPLKPVESKKAQAIQTLRRIIGTVSRMKDAGAQRSKVTANIVASDLNIGGVTGGDTMMRQLARGQIKLDWPTLRDAIWDDSTIIHELLSSSSTETIENK